MLFHFTVTEHDEAKRWLIVSTRTGLSLEAESVEAFRQLAAQQWPSPRFEVALEPGELSRALGVRRL